MSRIGKKPIELKKGITVAVANRQVTVKGPKGELKMQSHPLIQVDVKDNQVVVTRKGESKNERALHGLTRALIQTMIVGVTEGYSKKLEIVGVGYRAEVKGKYLQLLLGYSHPIAFFPPESVKVEAPTQSNIVVSGIDKQLVGMVASKIRSLRPPEPYQGKGIKYEGEYIRRKAGKAAAGAK